MLSILVHYVPAVGSFILPVANVLDQVSVRYSGRHLDTPAQQQDSCISDLLELTNIQLYSACAPLTLL